MFRRIGLRVTEIAFSSWPPSYEEYVELHQPDARFVDLARTPTLLVWSHVE
jgi:hypothetical protein